MKKSHIYVENNGSNAAWREDLFSAVSCWTKATFARTSRRCIILFSSFSSSAVNVLKSGSNSPSWKNKGNTEPWDTEEENVKDDSFSSGINFETLWAAEQLRLQSSHQDMEKKTFFYDPLACNPKSSTRILAQLINLRLRVEHLLSIRRPHPCLCSVMDKWKRWSLTLSN